jgi:hypothetical protein
MRPGTLCAASFLLICRSLSGGGLMDLTAAIGAATGQPQAEDVDLSIAKTRLEMLEAMNRRRLDFSPQIGILTLTNPIALAANTGASLIWKKNPVPPLALVDARIEVLAAQVEVSRRKFAREMEASSRFHEATESRHLFEQACAGARQAEAAGAALEGRFTAGLLTQADLLRNRQETIRRQAECRRSEKSLQMASVRLAAIVGVHLSDLKIRDYTETPAPPDVTRRTAALLPVDTLMNIALTYRAQPAGLRDSINGVRKQLDHIRETRGLQFSFRYSRYGQPGVFSGPSGSTAANWMQPEMALSIPLGKNNAFTLEKRLLLLKLRRVEQRLEEMEADIRNHLSVIRMQHESAAEEIPASRQALAVAHEYRKAIAARRSAGLETTAQLDAAEDATQQAALRMTQLQLSERSAYAAMLSLCGLRPEPNPPRQILITQR